MEQKIQLKYINTALQIGVVSWREVYALKPKPRLMLIEVYKGRLVYRISGSPIRVSYRQIKKGLSSTSLAITFQVPDWLWK